MRFQHEGLYLNFQGEKRMQQRKVVIERSVSLRDIGLDGNVGTEKAVFTFLDWAEAVATRWIQMPAGVLLCVTVPGDPRSGACYLYERRQGLFHCLELPGEDNGQLSTEDFDRLLRRFRLTDFARRPRKLYAPDRGEPPVFGAFASAACVG
jgi:hypothetical protein